MPTGPALGLPAPGARFYHLVQHDDVASGTRWMYCEIRALCAERLTTALDGTLRAVTAHAALTEAILETNIVRLADPIVPSSTLVEELARQLRGAGFSVSFGPSWIPSPGAEISLGARGLEEAFGAFLRAHPAWQRPPR